MSQNWIANKESQNLILENLKHSLAHVLATLYMKNIKVQIPELYLGTIEEIHKSRELGHIPTIAERLKNYIVFYYEILKDIIHRIDNDEEIEIFIQSVCLHEITHIFLDHNKGTSLEETEVNMWMTINTPEFQNIFLKYMPIVNHLGIKYKKE